MQLHLFRCNHCEDKPRLGDTTCGTCGRPVTFLNWIGTHFVLIIGAIVAGVYMLSH